MDNSRLTLWPPNWPPHRESLYQKDNCDMLVGPCVCGAWHKKGEFRFQLGILYRFEKEIERTNNVQ